MFSLSHNRFPLFYNDLNSDIARSGALSVLNDCRVSHPAAFDSFYMVLKCLFLVKGLEISNEEL